MRILLKRRLRWELVGQLLFRDLILVRGKKLSQGRVLRGHWGLLVYRRCHPMQDEIYLGPFRIVDHTALG